MSYSAERSLGFQLKGSEKGGEPGSSAGEDGNPPAAEKITIAAFRYSEVLASSNSPVSSPSHIIRVVHGPWQAILERRHFGTRMILQRGHTTAKAKLLLWRKHHPCADSIAINCQRLGESLTHAH